MRKHTITPIQDDDFAIYGLILCFDTDVHSKLLEKQISALESDETLAGNTRIVRLAGCIRFSGQDLAAADRTEAMVIAVKTVVRIFIATELGYPLDKITDDMGFRTLQFVLPEYKIAQFADADFTNGPK